MDEKEYIGCCGAYCKTCRSFIREKCNGCKIGFDTKERNINMSRCKVKLCCFRDYKFDTCADCTKLNSCNIMEKWYKKNGGKYSMYKKLLEFIKDTGYSKYISIANNWKREFGEINEK
jgi:hypothetical protein